MATVLETNSAMFSSLDGVLDFFDHPQFGAPRPRVVPALLGGRAYGLRGQNAKRRGLPFSPSPPASKMLLDDPVFQRMKRDDTQAPSGLQQVRARPEELFEAGKFFVHGDAQ